VTILGLPILFYFDSLPQTIFSVQLCSNFCAVAAYNKQGDLGVLVFAGHRSHTAMSSGRRASSVDDPGDCSHATRRKRTRAGHTPVNSQAIGGTMSRKCIYVHARGCT